MDLSQIKEALSKNILVTILTTIVVPAIITLITGPYINIYNFKGIIKKDGILSKDSVLVYKITSTQGDLKDVRFCFQISDSSLFSIKRTIYLDEDPTNTDFLQVGQSESGRPTNKLYDRCLKVGLISKGNYRLKIKLIIKKDSIALSRKVSKKDFTMVIDKLNQGIPEAIPVKPYKFYHIIFLYPIWTSIMVFVVLCLVAVIIKVKKTKPAEKADDPTPTHLEN